MCDPKNVILPVKLLSCRPLILRTSKSLIRKLIAAAVGDSNLICYRIDGWVLGIA